LLRGRARRAIGRLGGARPVGGAIAPRRALGVLGALGPASRHGALEGPTVGRGPCAALAFSVARRRCGELAAGARGVGAGRGVAVILAGARAVAQAVETARLGVGRRLAIGRARRRLASRDGRALAVRLAGVAARTAEATLLRAVAFAAEAVDAEPVRAFVRRRASRAVDLLGPADRIAAAEVAVPAAHVVGARLGATVRGAAVVLTARLLRRGDAFPHSVAGGGGLITLRSRRAGTGARRTALRAALEAAGPGAVARSVVAAGLGGARQTIPGGMRVHPRKSGRAGPVLAAGENAGTRETEPVARLVATNLVDAMTARALAVGGARSALLDGARAGIAWGGRIGGAIGRRWETIGRVLCVGRLGRITAVRRIAFRRVGNGAVRRAAVARARPRGPTTVLEAPVRLRTGLLGRTDEMPVGDLHVTAALHAEDSQEGNHQRPSPNARRPRWVEGHLRTSPE